MHRRELLRQAGLLGGAVALGGPRLLTGGSGDGEDGRAGRVTGSPRDLLDGQASDAPIDTVVVVMMENRSFDHYLGWLGRDDDYLEKGRRRHGRRFRVNGRQRHEAVGPDGVTVTGEAWADRAGEPNPFRGCGHPDPGHSWDQGRAQRDGGFLAPGSGNDAFALGYFEAESVPFISRLAREFTVFDAWHASVLGPTFPNREYLHSGQSGGHKVNDFPTSDGFPWETIWERLAGANVPAKYYWTDLPALGLWGPRHAGFMHDIEDYFTDAEAGRLPNVVMVDPAFLTGNRTDDHPHADIRAGQAFLRDVFAAFVESPHWESGLFILTYDEWGGFADHVVPPVLPDDLASPNDGDNFGQAGFRVPTVVASPYARRGFVDHRTYDHTSILRFLEWRFLGAPPEGPGKARADWFLTTRDRNAKNLGASLLGARRDADADVGFDLDVTIAPPSAPCPEDGGPPLPVASGATTPALATHALEDGLDNGYFERIGHDVRPSALVPRWVGAAANASW